MSASTTPKISVIVPARNEQDYLPACIESIGRASRGIAGGVEVVVVANRCTDGTAAIADEFGAVLVEDHSRTIAAVRNAGAARARGEVLVTLDADSLMSPAALSEVVRHLDTDAYVGGGSSFVTERRSVGIDLTIAFVRLSMMVSGLGGSMYWCRRADFEAILGFNESLTMAEDLDFARRLREHGRHTGRRFVNLRSAPVVTSCRKFDRFGDWHVFGMLRRMGEVRASLSGDDRAFVDSYFYDFSN
ncbi:MAG: glycosyl transferase family 2 [Ilumatobacteraceae bacterium]|nr:glycosyl transferase family 2 [Ilumatobacteraceae bacterium]